MDVSPALPKSGFHRAQKADSPSPSSLSQPSRSHIFCLDPTHAAATPSKFHPSISLRRAHLRSRGLSPTITRLFPALPTPRARRGPQSTISASPRHVHLHETLNLGSPRLELLRRRLHQDHRTMPPDPHVQTLVLFPSPSHALRTSSLSAKLRTADAKACCPRGGKRHVSAAATRRNAGNPISIVLQRPDFRPKVPPFITYNVCFERVHAKAGMPCLHFPGDQILQALSLTRGLCGHRGRNQCRPTHRPDDLAFEATVHRPLCKSRTCERTDHLGPLITRTRGRPAREGGTSCPCLLFFPVLRVARRAPPQQTVSTLARWVKPARTNSARATSCPHRPFPLRCT